ncbi:MAG TPA: tetratricopeptide repeat protein [Spirochaetota bacterium]|nr:tetratricopeptide repeat protein [Spirochaetota bacterium]HPI89080.1 tetratricopeptide repeat protein [Spirochaetota bacterium]HPR48709.1 tetratricopeptide repeat protein [Spirochaetota bacterium]
MRTPVLSVIIISLMFFSYGCKKTDKELLSQEMKLAASSGLNKKIAALKDRLDDAETDFQRAEIYTDIASIESEKGDHSSCQKSSRQAIKFQPNQHRSHYLLGRSYLAADRVDEAEKELLVSIDLNASYAPAHFEMGNAYYRKKLYQKALEEYEITVDLEPAHYMAHNNTGVIQSLLGNQNASLQAFRKAVAARPDFPQPYKNMGIIYDIYLKDRSSAIAQYRKYLELRPNSHDRRLVKSWIESLGG